MAANSNTVRLSEDIEKRLDRLALEMSRAADGVKVTRSDVLRRLVEQALPAAEKRFGLKQGT